MSSDVGRFSPPTEALALQYEHLENRTWANRSISRVLAEINVNNLTDQATRSRQKNGPADPQTRQCQKQGELVTGVADVASGEREDLGRLDGEHENRI